MLQLERPQNAQMHLIQGEESRNYYQKIHYLCSRSLWHSPLPLWPLSKIWHENSLFPSAFFNAKGIDWYSFICHGTSSITSRTSGHYGVWFFWCRANWIKPAFWKGVRRGIVDGIDIIEFELPYSNALSFLKRVLIFLSFAFKSIRVALTEPYDVVLPQPHRSQQVFPVFLQNGYVVKPLYLRCVIYGQNYPKLWEWLRIPSFWWWCLCSNGCLTIQPII